MPRVPKVRLVLLVPPSIVQRYMALSERYGFSRNEVCRYALEHGFAATVAWCKRTEAIFTDGAAELTASAQNALPLGTPGNRSSVSGVPAAVVDPAVALRNYAGIIASQGSGFDQEVFRSMLAAQAAVLGLSPVASAPLVDTVVLERFPGDVRAGGGDVPAESTASDVADPDTLPELDPAGPVVELD